MFPRPILSYYGVHHAPGQATPRILGTQYTVALQNDLSPVTSFGRTAHLVYIKSL
jgi:hypothetical protein